MIAVLLSRSLIATGIPKGNGELLVEINSRVARRGTVLRVACARVGRALSARNDEVGAACIELHAKGLRARTADRYVAAPEWADAGGRVGERLLPIRALRLPRIGTIVVSVLIEELFQGVFVACVGPESSEAVLEFTSMVSGMCNELVENTRRT